MYYQSPHRRSYPLDCNLNLSVFRLEVLSVNSSSYMLLLLSLKL